MLISTAQKEDLPPTEAHEASDDVAGDACVGVADVRLVVDVVNGRRNLEGTLAVIKGGGGRSRDRGEEGRRGRSGSSSGLSSADQGEGGSTAASAFVHAATACTCP